MGKKNTLDSLKNKIKYYWKQAKPSVLVFGKVTWFMTKIIIVLGLAGLMAGGGVAAGIAAGVFQDMPEWDPDAPLRPEIPSYIYDKNGDLITEIHDAHNRIPVTIDELPQHLIEAFLAAEDNNFWEHPGFDAMAILRAFVTGHGGGSTITQQTVKQVFLTPEQTIQRKLQELFISLQLEKMYTKEEIFEFYINNATFFGNGAYGVEAAAQTYFDKSVGELTLSEAALLAGIPNWPSRYAPDPNDMEVSLNRRDDVLWRMLRFGYITEEERQQAAEEEITLVPRQTRGWKYPHYTDAIVHDFALEILTDEENGLYETKAEAERALRRDGLHIYTALDPEIQELIEENLFDDSNFPRDSFVEPDTGRRYPQAGAVIMEAQTGHVLGMVGGREWSSSNRLQRAYGRHAQFQPGSAIKPVLVYGPAFEYGVMGTGSVIDDSPGIWSTPSGPWTPENVNRTFRGLVTVRDAMAYSDNLPAIRTYEQVGGRQATEFGSKLLGKDITRTSGHLSSAIGGSDYGVSPLEMARAFSGFANRGVVSEPIFITKIEDRDGNPIYEASIKQEVVMSEETAYMMTSILRDVVTRGTARPSNTSGFNVVAKTGTTDEAHDRWTVGYSRDYVFSLWMGNDWKVYIDKEGNRHTVRGLTGDNSYTLLNRIWGNLVRGTIKDDVPFPGRPSGVVSVTVCTKSGLLPSDLCPSTRSELFLRSNAPSEVCDMHIEMEVCSESGLLATEYCPSDILETQVFLNRPPFIPTDERWNPPLDRKPADADQMPPEDYCDMHGPTYQLSGNYGSNGVTLIWNNDLLEERENVGYNLYRRGPGESEFKKVNSQQIAINRTQYTDDLHPIPGLTYTYRLRVVAEDDRERDIHPEFSFMRELNLNLQAELTGDREVTLTWSSIANQPAIGVHIWRNGERITSSNNPVALGSSPHVRENQPVGTHEYQLSVVYEIGGNRVESARTSAATVTVPAPDDNGNGGDDNGDNGDNGEGEDNGNGNGSGENGDGAFRLLPRWFRVI
ncbi:MAG: hypothetical protein FH749_11950 [Firmicutes bacterium]|nr:hypothetical protein [Bacillota bacterium]